MRGHNEDRWCAYKDIGLFVVADGMGGGPAGKLASEIVVQALPRSSPNASIAARDHPGAGCNRTLCAALIRDGWALIAHIGDSRAYLRRDGRLRQLTPEKRPALGEMLRALSSGWSSDHSPHLGTDGAGPREVVGDGGLVGGARR